MPLKGREALMRRLEENSDKLLRALALETHRRLIRKTPVDKGRARNNWNAAIGSPDVGTSDAATYDRSGQSAITEGMSVIGVFKAGERFYSTNSLPYIPALEDGSSTQAPNGMIKVTVAELKPLVAKIAARIAAGGE